VAMDAGSERPVCVCLCFSSTLGSQQAAAEAAMDPGEAADPAEERAKAAWRRTQVRRACRRRCREAAAEFSVCAPLRAGWADGDGACLIGVLDRRIGG
jgi:hypothetical protein